MKPLLPAWANFDKQCPMRPDSNKNIVPVTHKMRGGICYKSNRENLGEQRMGTEAKSCDDFITT
jgi:hypothetical protein